MYAVCTWVVLHKFVSHTGQLWHWKQIDNSVLAKQTFGLTCFTTDCDRVTLMPIHGMASVLKLSSNIPTLRINISSPNHQTYNRDMANC